MGGRGFVRVTVPPIPCPLAAGQWGRVHGGTAESCRYMTHLVPIHPNGGRMGLLCKLEVLPWCARTDRQGATVSAIELHPMALVALVAEKICF